MHRVLSVWVGLDQDECTKDLHFFTNDLDNLNRDKEQQLYEVYDEVLTRSTVFYSTVM